MCTKIKTIIFSKNRACQLELLLRSLNMPATVLYTYDPDFRLGYEKLIKMHSDVVFVKETNFREQLIQLIDPYTMFLVDDDIMIEHFNDKCPELVEFQTNPDILCLSLRISPHYKYAPTLTNNTWQWKGEKKDWGYPMSVSSTVFRKEDILPVIMQKEFRTPNGLEVELRHSAPNKRLMLCLNTPKIINNLANRVQNTDLNHRTAGVSLRELEQGFLESQILSLVDIKEKAKNAQSCFLKTHYKWV